VTWHLAERAKANPLRRFAGRYRRDPANRRRCGRAGSGGGHSLLDVRLIGMSPSAFSLSGFERVDGVEYAQSWLVQDTE